jgi:hypothetical protein
VIYHPDFRQDLVKFEILQYSKVLFNHILIIKDRGYPCSNNHLMYKLGLAREEAAIRLLL